ncbi:hypothetical protein [Paraoerskovia sediminicola]|uniref:hypothetical protein n=1 Tax=Paraoerskovia sediminicola TaxID=1138587 RepID=UPI0025746C0F|nr:hypothetical protein [Paraoerskovia sediminicola]
MKNFDGATCTAATVTAAAVMTTPVSITSATHGISSARPRTGGAPARYAPDSASWAVLDL